MSGTPDLTARIGPDGDLNVSLEDHLAKTLRPLVPMLPKPLAAELTDVLRHFASSETAPRSTRRRTPTVPYTLLTAISKWSRTPATQRAFSSHEPPLSAQDYSILALLAGTRTFPNRAFPHNPNPSTEEVQAAHKRELGDRRAVTALANALLSIAGAAIATWWAAGRLAWRDEWKVLLALSVAIIVASSEAILYLIWQNRRTNPTSKRRTRPVFSNVSPHHSDKRLDPDHSEPSTGTNTDLQGPVVITATSTNLPGTSQSQLRERGVANEQAERATRHNQ